MAFWMFISDVKSGKRFWDAFVDLLNVSTQVCQHMLLRKHTSLRYSDAVYG